jgi:hypothetical protein
MSNKIDAGIATDAGPCNNLTHDVNKHRDGSRWVMDL